MQEATEETAVTAAGAASAIAESAAEAAVAESAVGAAAEGTRQCYRLAAKIYCTSCNSPHLPCKQ